MTAERLLVLFVVLATLYPAGARGQERRAVSAPGLPFFFEHFEPQHYQAHPQSWAIVQDARGVIYVGNSDGILEFDGARWHRLLVPARTVVRSLAATADGVVFAGAKGDLGYVHVDETGTSSFVSLLDEVPVRARQFKDVWGTHATEDGVFFQTEGMLMRWKDDRMRLWQTENGFHTSFAVNGRVFLREKNVGLVELVGDSLRLVPDGGRFADLRVYVMLPHSPGRILVGTREEGFFLYDGAEFTPFATEADRYLAEHRHRLYHGCVLPGGRFALATLDGGGVVIMDRDGGIVRVLSEEAGLPDGWVNFVMADAQGGLWVAMNNKGIARLDVPSPLTRYDERLGLSGLINDVIRYEGTLYVATTTGLYRLTEPSPQAASGRWARFAPVRLDVNQALALARGGSGLFIASDTEVLLFDGHSATAVAEVAATALRPSRRFDDRLYVGTRAGVLVLERRGRAWVQVEMAAAGEEVYALEEDEGGLLWATTRSRHVLRVAFHEASGRVAAVDRFHVPEAMSRSEIPIALIDGKVFFASEQGLFRLSDEEGAGTSGYRFIRTDLLPDASGGLLHALETTEDGRFWAILSDRVEVIERRPDASLERHAPEILRYPAWQSPNRVYIEENGVTWLSSGATLLRYDPDPRFHRSYDTPFQTLIRRVVTVDGERPVHALKASESGLQKVPQVAPGENALVFEYAAPSFNDVGATEYQYMLEGRDVSWSEWTQATSRSYTNLWEGSYTFRVRARNGQGIVSESAAFSFGVRPPWYRSWWAYAVYAASLMLLLVFVWLYQRMRAENQRAREQAVLLEQQRVHNERLQHLNRRLQEANESLTQAAKLKDEFLANTSHELRTPLTAILGFAKVLKEEVPSEHVEFLDFIEENGRRLLSTLDAVLDLARLRSGTMTVAREKIDVGRLVREAAGPVEVEAAKKGLRFAVETPCEPVYASLDPRCFEAILKNLLGNALKFTEAGAIRVGIRKEGDRVHVAVEDTGVGIDESFRPHLFEAFKQESEGLTRSHQGNGLGLAVTARLVELLDGAIQVESTKGKGSRFTVTFEAWRPEHAAERPALEGDGSTTTFEVVTPRAS